MSAVRWDPGQYLQYRDERLRPFLSLLERIASEDPSEVVDLGCGPGNATKLICELWPNASVVGIDNAAEMIEQALPLAVPGKLEFRRGDISTWTPDHLVDVIVSNAAFQWVPGHTGRFANLVASLKPGGWFAFQVPNMGNEPSHLLLTELATSPRWADRLASLTRSLVVEPTSTYLDLLQGLGCQVDAWETTYMQVLPGEDAVLEWTRGSSMRPFLTALGPAEAKEFENTYRERVAPLYPRKAAGTVYPFRRIFVVAHKGA